MDYWDKNSARELAERLKKARSDFSTFPVFIHCIEDSQKDGSRYNNRKFSQEECKRYFLFLLDKFILSQKQKIGGITPELMCELLTVVFGIHPDYPRDQFVSVQDRRIAFAKKNHLIKRSNDPASVAHSCWYKEDQGIKLLIYAIGKDLTEKQKRRETLGYGAVVFESEIINSIKQYVDDSDEENKKVTIQTDDEEIAVPQEFIRAVKYGSNYSSLGVDTLKKALHKTESCSAIFDATELNSTIVKHGERIKRNIVNILKHDMTCLNMFARAIADVPIDPFIRMLAGTPSEKDSSLQINIPFGRGRTVGDEYPWVYELVDMFDVVKEKVEEGAVNSSQPFFSKDWLLNMAFEGGKQPPDSFWELGNNIDKLMERFQIKGVVYARTSRNFRIDLKKYELHEWCAIEERHQRTCDWIVFDYYNDEKIHAFSVGFRTELLRLAVFTPLPPMKIFD